MERSTMSQPDPVDLQPRELLQIAADFFEVRGIAYRVVGSMASIAYPYPSRLEDRCDASQENGVWRIGTAASEIKD